MKIGGVGVKSIKPKAKYSLKRVDVLLLLQITPVVIALLFCIPVSSKEILGDIVLRFFRLPAWTYDYATKGRGTHYTALYIYGALVLATILQFVDSKKGN
jgi:hypothetical protein